MAQQRHPPGPPMTLGNMRALGVQTLIASRLDDACRHTALLAAGTAKTLGAYCQNG
jgi:hypothetical protein